LIRIRLERAVFHHVFKIGFKLLAQAEEALRKPNDIDTRQFQVLGKSRISLLGIVPNNNTAIIHLLADQFQEII